MFFRDRILVCVTQQKTCERLIRYAAKLRDETGGGDLFVIHVARNDWKFLNNTSEGEALEYLFGISKSVGANLSVLKSDKIVETISEFARQNSINRIVIGKSAKDYKETQFHTELMKQLPHIDILVLPQE